MKHSTKKHSDKQGENGEFEQLFSRLESAAKRLNAAAQDAGRRIEDLEERLAVAEPGISVWGATLLTEPTTFQAEGEEPEEAERVLRLGYARVKKGKWGIAVREVVRSRTGAILADDTSLVSKAERAVRLLALPHLEALTRQVVEAVEAQAAKLQDDQEDEAEHHAEQPSRAPSESAQN